METIARTPLGPAVDSSLSTGPDVAEAALDHVSLVAMLRLEAITPPPVV